MSSKLRTRSLILRHGDDDEDIVSTNRDDVVGVVTDWAVADDGEIVRFSAV
jgi:hypothetical protein